MDGIYQGLSGMSTKLGISYCLFLDGINEIFLQIFSENENTDVWLKFQSEHMNILSYIRLMLM